MSIIFLFTMSAPLMMLSAGMVPVGRSIEPGEPGTELMRFYEGCIDGVVSRSQKYVVLVNSDSEYIRSYASAMLQKAAFLKRNRLKLVREMAKLDIGRHPRTIDCYLNQKFFGALKAVNKKRESPLQERTNDD